MLAYKQTYDLEFKLIPKLCDLYQDATNIFENFNDNRMTSKDFMEAHTEGNNINWDDFNFSKKILPNGAIEFIYDFSVPSSYPLCRFAIFYVDKAKNIYEYITLERMMAPGKYPYCVCGQKGTKHKNYSLECAGNLESFEAVVKEIIDKGIKPILGIKFAEED